MPILEQPGHRAGHHHQGLAVTLAADKPKDMLALRPFRLDREVVPGGKESWVRTAAIV